MTKRKELTEWCDCCERRRARGVTLCRMHRDCERVEERAEARGDDPAAAVDAYLAQNLYKYRSEGWA